VSTNLTTSTHEAYIAGIRDLILVGAADLTDEERSLLEHTKLLYGAGQTGVRGICYYDAWENGVGKVAVVEIGAQTQESWVQLAGTTVHELGHVLAGSTAGHSVAWKDACKRLGFTKRPEAAGQTYTLALFKAGLRHDAAALAATIADGSPAFRATFASLGLTFAPRPCGAGYGTKGGTSRGKGSGSRSRLYICGHGQKIRAATDTLNATCGECGTAFEKAS
jgi:hypothetical protein